MREIDRLKEKIETAVGENVFVINRKDVEALECIKLLKENGYVEKKNLFIIKRHDIDSWEKVNAKLHKKIDDAFTIIDIDVKLPDGSFSNEYLTIEEYNELIANKDKKGCKAPASSPIMFGCSDYVRLYGVKMEGTAPKFGDNLLPGEKSIIRQIADIIDVDLELKQELLGIYIDFGKEALEKYGKEHGLEDEDIEKFIKNIDSFTDILNEKNKEQVIKDFAKSYKRDALVNNKKIQELSENEYILSELIDILKENFEYEVMLPEGFEVKPDIKGCIQIKGNDIPFEIRYSKKEDIMIKDGTALTYQKEVAKFVIEENIDKDVLKQMAFINYSSELLKNLEEFKIVFEIDMLDEDIIDFIKDKRIHYLGSDIDIENCLKELIEQQSD